VRFPQPPTLAAPSNLTASEQSCDSSAPSYKVQPSPPPVPKQRLFVTYSVKRPTRSVAVKLHVSRGALSGLVAELLRGKRVVARAPVRHVGIAAHRVVLHPLHGHRFAPGHYRLLVRHGGKTLARRGVIIT
jgi:hypothetical protein